MWKSCYRGCGGDHEKYSGNRAVEFVEERWEEVVEVVEGIQEKIREKVVEEVVGCFQRESWRI